MPKGRSRLSLAERRVWDAAYSAAFAIEFHAAKERIGWDRAQDITSAEPASQIADMAVRELRHWRREENKELGHSLEVR